MTFSLLDISALMWFIVSWAGYTAFARIKAKDTDCIARGLNKHRIYWMLEVMTRNVRVGDAALLANLERNIAFFASTTLFVLAGVLTLFAQVERLESVISTIPFAAPPQSFTGASQTCPISWHLCDGLLPVYLVNAPIWVCECHDWCGAIRQRWLKR